MYCLIWMAFLLKFTYPQMHHMFSRYSLFSSCSTIHWGLDTLNPILTIDGKIKLIGQYDETIGTCLVFNESDDPPVVPEDAGPSEANLFPGRHMSDPKQTKSKQIMPVTLLQKILKFRLLEDCEAEDAREKPKED
ncbi:uncharacterized protein LOC132617900 isoform X2 [Lycium barbarum]|uniref:uncharacterized protein LOC132617900 isoform X2 n=1 Tax=Lycium barbarum TaxID=112863 RepID=UPI00293F31E5|nr:uncharacterized protein LOC132617900 isoform X2 [Lycium barbarum]